MRRFARRLMGQEMPLESKSSYVPGQATFQVLDDLRPQVVKLMGMAGFRGLLSRAIAVGSDEVRWLRAVHIAADGSLEGFEEHAQLSPAEFAEGKIVLLAQLLGMLVDSIGADSTVRLVLDTWPNLSLDDLNLGNGEADGNE
jgi:hypothetical protein